MARTTITREKIEKKKRIEKVRKKRWSKTAQDRLVAEGMAILFPITLS